VCRLALPRAYAYAFATSATAKQPALSALSVWCAGDGSIRIFGSGNKLLYTLSNLTATSAATNLPCTAIRFRPATASAKSKNSVLIASSMFVCVAWSWHQPFRVWAGINCCVVRLMGDVMVM
jgi:hypothetical protein